jgi:1-acyl-sn-glycerol-3-phosphate acyltransferase
VFFRRIERFRVDRVPARGPVLFVANHPGSATDAFLIGTSVPRAVNFVATASLFRNPLMAGFLHRCGVIPVNRRQDDPTKMHLVEDTFARCYDAFDAGGAIAIFPEGVTYDDERLRPIKTGAARLALGAESRRQGQLGLRIVPVGLTYSAKDRFRSDVLVQFGEPIDVAGWIDSHREDPVGAVRGLTAEIERRLRELILDLPSSDHQQIVSAVKRLYLDTLRAGNLIVREPMPRAAEELVLTQAISSALRHFETHYPERLTEFVVDLMHYERRLWVLGLTDRDVTSAAPADAARARQRLARLVAGAPVALYGWIHHFGVAWLIDVAIRRSTPAMSRRAEVPHRSMIAGLIGFGVLYLVLGSAMWWLAGGWIALLYVVSLPLAGIFASRYLQWLWRYGANMRLRGRLRRIPFSQRGLLRRRERLIEQIEGFRADYRREVLGI